MSTILHPLEIERVMPTLLRTLETAGLDKAVLSNMLLKGTCGVLAEAAIPADRLYRFDEGGFNPQGKRTARSGYTVSEVLRNSDDLSRTLDKEKVFRTYYVHEPLKRPDEVPADDYPSLVIEGQLLYVRDATLLAVDDLASFVSKNTLSWHFLMFCTANHDCTYTQMENLLSDSICLVSGVYDGESYLVWMRQSE